MGARDSGPIANANGWLLISQGRAREMFNWGLIGGTMSIIAIVVGLPWGPVGVAAAYALSGVAIRTPLSFWYVCRKGPVRSRDIYRIVALPTIVVILESLVLLLIRLHLSNVGFFTSIALAFGPALTLVLVLYILFSPGREILADIKEMIFIIAKRRSIRYTA